MKNILYICRNMKKVYNWLFTYEVYNYFDGHTIDVYSRFTNKWLYRKYL